MEGAMFFEFPIEQHMDKRFATVDPEERAENILEALDKSDANYLIVARQGRPLAVLPRWEVALRSAPIGAPGSEARGLPPLIVVEQDVKQLSLDELLAFGLVLAASRASAVAVVDNAGDVVGVMGADTIGGAIAAHLATSLAGTRAELFGNVQVKTRGFICNQCNPPQRRWPGDATTPPTCPADPSHGSMQPEYL
jgi:hypothetical protein